MAGNDVALLLQTVQDIQSGKRELAAANQRISEVERQLQTIQGFTGLSEPLSLISAWQESNPTTTPAHGTFVGVGQLLLAGTGVTFEKPVHSPFIRIKATSTTSANYDYVVASDGSGTHLKLHGAGGALLVAIATGVSKSIWICTTHTETQSAADVCTLAANQIITIQSAGGLPVVFTGASASRPTITVGHAGSVLTFSAESDATSKIVMKGYHYFRSAVNAGHFADVTGGHQMPSLVAEEMAFDSNTSNGSWGYWLDARTSTGKIGDLRWRNVQYFGLSAAASSVISAIVATQSSSVSANHMDILDSDFTVTNLWYHANTNTDVDPANQMAFLGNRMTVIQTLAADTGQTRIGYVGDTNARGFTCNDNTILFKSTSDFIRFGDVKIVKDFEVVGNYFNAIASGSAATTFINLRNDAGTVNNATIQGNTIVGPGSGTAINVNGAAATASQFGNNAFRNWTTNVGGSGAMTTIFGPVTFPGAVTFSTTVTFTTSITVTTFENIGTYLNVGSLSAPTNTTAGDITGIRLNIGSQVAFAANVGSLAIYDQTSAATAAGANVMIQATQRYSVSGDSSSEFRVLNFQNRIGPTEDHNFSGRFTGGYFEGIRPEGSGNISSTSLGGANGVTGIGAAYGSGMDDAGTVTAATGIVGLGYNRATASFTTKAITTARGIFAPNPTALSGLTVTTYIGMDIDALTSLSVGTGRIGLRNADTTVFTPTAQQSIAVSAAIVADATVVQVSTTTAANMTATPTVADGSDGQFLLIVNTGTNTFTLQDQGTLASSNLRLSATGVALATRDSILLMYSSSVGDWVQIGQTNVI